LNNFSAGKAEYFHINRYITVVNLFSISQWLWH